MSEKNEDIKLNKRSKINEKFYLSTSFYGALFFSLALWFYTVMNDEYQTVIQVPLSVQLPENKSIEKKLPKNLNIVAKGNGWNLLNLMYFNTSKNCNINLENRELNSNLYEVTRQEILKSIEFFQNVETRDVIPDNFKINYGTLFSKKVKVVPDVKIATIDNFIFTDSIKITPSEITVKGNKNTVQSLEYIKTKHIDFFELNESVDSYVELDDSLSSILSLSESKVKIEINVQHKSNIILDGINVNDYINESNLKCIPDNFKVIISGGVEDLQKINLNQFYKSLKLVKIKNSEFLYEFKTEFSKDFKIKFFPKYIKINEVIKYL